MLPDGVSRLRPRIGLVQAGPWPTLFLRMARHRDVVALTRPESAGATWIAVDRIDAATEGLRVLREESRMIGETASPPQHR